MDLKTLLTDRDLHSLFGYWLYFDREEYRTLLFTDIAYRSRKIQQELSTVNAALQETNKKLDQLREDVNRHLTNINNELLLQSKILGNIESILKSKRKTEAEELKNYGIFALRNGWYDEATEDFLESLKFNKYDYQVYFFLSKIYGNTNESENQVTFINKALKYGIQDEEFMQYVYMDMIFLCIEAKDFETGEKLAKTSLKIKKSTASCLSSAILDIYKKNISEETYNNIELAIESYESETPAKIIDVIQVLASTLDADVKSKIENIINKQKFKILKKYVASLYQKINNLKDILTQIQSDDQFIVKVVPHHLILKHCPHFNTLSNIINQVDAFRSKLETAPIEFYDEVVSLPPLIDYINGRFIAYYCHFLSAKVDNSSLLTNPFSEKFKSTLKITLTQNEIQLMQVPLGSGKHLTLTSERLIITKEKGKSLLINIEDLTDIEMEILNKTDTPVQLQQGTYQFEAITFLLKKKSTGQILLIDKSLYYSTTHGSGNNLANLLTLLWLLAEFNSNIINSMQQIDSGLQFINNIIKSYDEKLSTILSKQKSSDNEVEFISDSDNDVEFVD